MSLRDVCDVAFVLRLEEARRQSQMLALAAVMSGGDFVDPVGEFLAELEEEPTAARPDRELRRALGLST